MNKKIRVTSILLLLVIVTALTATAQARPLNFRAHLSGDQEVPAVDTQARGQTIFQLNPAGDELSFRLIVANLNDTTQAHIHCGAEGTNGPVVAFLYGFDLIEGRFSGVLATGTLTNADVIPRPDSDACPGGVANFDEMIQKIQDGEAYVNVHTVANPAGEIRGQIR